MKPCSYPVDIHALQITVESKLLALTCLPFPIPPPVLDLSPIILRLPMFNQL